MQAGAGSTRQCPAVPGASAVGSGSTHPCPTSRGHGRFFAFLVGRERAQTAASPRAGTCRLRRVGRRCLAPVGQGALRGCGSDAVCAVGAKALLCGAPDFGGFTGKSTLRGGLPFRRGRQARWEGGESGVVVRLQGMERAFILVRRSASSIRGERGGPHLPRVAKTVRLPFPHLPRSRNHPAGRTAGSARTRPRDQSLGDPFLGNAPVVSLPPVPQNAAGGRPLLVGLPPSIPAFAPTGTKRRTPAPCSWGGRSSTSSQRRCQPALPAASASSAAWSWASVCASGAW